MITYFGVVFLKGFEMRPHSSLEMGSMGILQPDTQVLILVCGDVFTTIHGEAPSDA